MMRTRFRENVDRLAADLATMCVHAESVVADATGALLTVDLDLAEQVITTREWFDTAAQGWEHRALALLALQAPVASDLRTLVGGLDVTSDLQRMGDLAVDIADLTRHRHPVAVVPEEVRGVFADMGRLAAAHAAVAEYVLRHRDV
ncbi:phosphate signaling complex PhoU family protein, partial [Rhodococcus koreensis]